MDGIIEHVNVKYDPDIFLNAFRQVSEISPITYIECGANSWILNAHPEYRNLWAPILSQHSKVHDQFCGFATGFNFNKTNEHTVPPHIDVGPAKYYNLLIPVFGVARIDIFQTKMEELEFRYGEKHWMMQKHGSTKNKIGSLLVDRPTLLNTDWLHSVQPEISPRCVWCTRWLGVDPGTDFKIFKSRVEAILGA